MPSSPQSPRPLRIGILVALLPPEHLGGAELQADRLARELARRGHDVHVFARRQAGRLMEETRAGVHIHRRPVSTIPGWRPLSDVLRGARQVARHEPDVLLCFITINSGLIGWAARRRCGVPFIIWQRQVAESLFDAPAWERRLAFFLNRRAAAVWVQAESFVDPLQREYERAGRAREWREISRHLRAFGNGIELPVAAPAPAGPPPPWRFLFVGRLTPQKDFRTLLAAMRELPESELWIAGSGPLASKLELEAQGLPVRFLGSQPAERIAGLLLDCRALVLTSPREGVPNAVLEALSHGRPVVANPVGAIPELVRDGENGRIVPVGDVQGLVQALLDLRDDETWRRLATAARPSVERFAWPRLVEQVETELAAVVAASGPR